VPVPVPPWPESSRATIPRRPGTNSRIVHAVDLPKRRLFAVFHICAKGEPNWFK
jgi:hypothetical protein